ARLLVRSYFKACARTFSPLPRLEGRGGMLSVALSRSFSRRPERAAASDGGRYPPPRPVEPGLSSPRPPSAPQGGSRGAPGDDRPAGSQTLLSLYSLARPRGDGRLASRQSGRSPEGRRSILSAQGCQSYNGHHERPTGHPVT